MDADAVRDAEMLLVRSVTRVDQGLLEGSRVRFVGTATIGTDHIDTAWLREAGIAFASAPGSNANSVAEYIVAALLVLADWRGFRFADKALGIIGHGNVGKRVERKARALGLEVALNDPPLARETGDAKYRPLDEVLERCDILTFHVPLTREGEDATFEMLNGPFFDRVKTGTVILNTSRGRVAHGPDLRAALEDGRVGACVLDVWPGEPDIDLELLANLALGTPHIAGYSFDGKVNGTQMLHEAACAFLGGEARWDPAALLPPPDRHEVEVPGDRPDFESTLRDAVLPVYDIRRDDDALRGIIRTPAAERPAYFDRLRKEYPRRREFHTVTARLRPHSDRIAEALRELGFKVARGR
jgi:erythronate-4-phosphate dehydrogenase